MVASTPINAIPYRVGTDAPDIAGATVGIANGIDRKLVPSFATPTERDSKIPAPTFGMVCSVASLLQFQFHDGNGWKQIDTGNRYASGVFSGSTSAGAATITHNLGVVPSLVLTDLRESAVAGYVILVNNGSTTAQTQFKVYQSSTGTTFTGSQPIVFGWRAIV